MKRVFPIGLCQSHPAGYCRKMSAVGLIVLLMLAGCSAHFPINQSLATREEPLPDYLYKKDSTGRSDELLVVLAFSGGGMRASALSYGVLKALQAFPIETNNAGTNLLNEVDLISSVSGGSFTAAYYGLYGQDIFNTYEDRFLKCDVEGDLVLELLKPSRWFKLGSTYYDRSELAEDYYDRKLFKGATLGDLAAQPGPAVLINATDLTLGTGFVFHQEQFDWLCSDISQFSLSRAVTASSAVPGLFSAVTMYNYGGQCEDKVPAWMASSLWKHHPQLQPLARKIQTYRDSKAHPYIHLMDGGLADNLGLRAVMERIAIHGGAQQALEDFNLRQTRKILIISVNAAAAPATDINQVENPPTAFFSVDAATTIQINLYNQETMQRFRENVRKWQEEISLSRCGRRWCPEGVDFYFVDINLANMDSREERNFLQRLPTTFRLEPEAVDRLIGAADTLLRSSAEFQRFLRDSSKPESSAVLTRPGL